MEFSYRSLGAGLLIGIIVIAFTFGTSFLTAGLQSYNLAISAAFVMGGLFCICLSAVLKMVHLSGKEDPDEGTVEDKALND